MTRHPFVGLALLAGLALSSCAAQSAEPPRVYPSPACVSALQDVSSSTDDLTANARFELAAQVCDSVADLTATVQAYPDSLGLANPTEADIRALLAVVCPKLANARLVSTSCDEVGMGIPGKR